MDGSTRILAYWDQSLPFASFNKENTNSNSSNSDNFQYISTTNSQNNYIAADNRTNTRRNNVSKHSSAIDNPYNLGVIFSEEDLNRLLMPKSSSVPSDSSTFSVTDPVTELLSPSEDVSGMAPISQVSAQETGVPAMEIVRGCARKFFNCCKVKKRDRFCLYGLCKSYDGG